ncbi:MAG: haloacid dehalogenase-like hydrolase [Spirochaetales bacterium]|nr:haloacid dehalogenase-like hydrolase [Spirochaetales bacterium]
MKRIAFFDLDYTLIPYDTLLLFTNYILQKNRWRTFYLLYLPLLLPLALLRILNSGQLKRRFLCFLFRMQSEYLIRLSQSFVETEVLPRLYPEVLEELKAHQQAGDLTVLNTASPEFYVQFIARALKFDHCFATRIALPPRLPFHQTLLRANNKHIQKLRSMPAELLSPALTARVDQPFDYAAIHEHCLKDAVTYTDSAADLPLLAIAGNGVLIHPSPALEKRGQGKWKVLRPKRPYRGSAGRLLRSMLMALGVFYGR